jgi:hypothetical protein
MKAIITSAIIGSVITLVSCASPGAAQSKGVKRYTSDLCAVTDNKLGSMGDPVTKIYGNQEVKFCCKPCVAKYEKNPGKYADSIR